jgi:AbrB family looped-hinge helix DNA binding protein
MPVSAKAVPAQSLPAKGIHAKVTSKGQITIPVAIRKSLGVKPGDSLRFEPQEVGFRVVRDAEENVFEKWRGIGGFPGMGKGRDAIVAYFREMRGDDDLD